MVDGLIRLMGSADDCVGPVNLGNPAEISILELADLIRNFTRSKSRIVRRPLPSDDPRQRQPDITLARNYLAWAPETGFADGLARTVEYFRQIISN
jgi:UDP-glucuronate decarboxylase